MAKHTLITITVEELELIKDQAGARAEDLEWQLRREIARLREIESNLLRMLGDEPARALPLPAPTATAPAPVRASNRAARLRAALLHN
jgi:uncharacterized membrane protein YccC